MTLVDPSPGTGASYAAAGMLSPSAELWHGEEELLRLGRESLALWPEYADRLGVRLRTEGTLLVGFDAGDLQQVARQVALLREARRDRRAAPGRRLPAGRGECRPPRRRRRSCSRGSRSCRPTRRRSRRDGHRDRQPASDAVRPPGAGRPRRDPAAAVRRSADQDRARLGSGRADLPGAARVEGRSSSARPPRSTTGRRSSPPAAYDACSTPPGCCGRRSTAPSWSRRPPATGRARATTCRSSGHSVMEPRASCSRPGTTGTECCWLRSRRTSSPPTSRTATSTRPSIPAVWKEFSDHRQRRTRRTSPPPSPSCSSHGAATRARTASRSRSTRRSSRATTGCGGRSPMATSSRS